MRSTTIAKLRTMDAGMRVVYVYRSADLAASDEVADYDSIWRLVGSFRRNDVIPYAMLDNIGKRFQ